LSKRNFDYKKAINRKKKMKKVAAIAATSLILTFPVNSVINTLNLPGLQNNVVHAQNLANVNVLTDVKLSGAVQTVPGQPSELSLTMTSGGLADTEVLNPNIVTQFYAPELAGNLVEGGTANVSVDILPITRENLPGLYSAVGGLTTTVTDLTNEIGTLVDELLNISPGILQVNGLDDVLAALDALNNLESSLDSLTSYKEADIPVTINEDGTITVEYGDGLGKHLQETIDSIVVELLDDLSQALANLEIKLLEGGINTENILDLVNNLDNLPLLGDVLAPLLGDGPLGKLIDALGGLLGPILDPLIKPLLGPAVEGAVGALENLVNELLTTVGNLTAEVTNVADQVTDLTTDLVNDLAALKLIAGTTVNVNSVKVSEKVCGNVEIKGLAVQDAVIDLDLFANHGTGTSLDFGECLDDSDADADADAAPQRQCSLAQLL